MIRLTSLTWKQCLPLSNISTEESTVIVSLLKRASTDTHSFISATKTLNFYLCENLNLDENVLRNLIVIFNAIAEQFGSSLSSGDNPPVTKAWKEFSLEDASTVAPSMKMKLQVYHQNCNYCLT